MVKQPDGLLRSLASDEEANNSHSAYFEQPASVIDAKDTTKTK